MGDSGEILVRVGRKRRVEHDMVGPWDQHVSVQSCNLHLPHDAISKASFPFLPARSFHTQILVNDAKLSTFKVAIVLVCAQLNILPRYKD